MPHFLLAAVLAPLPAGDVIPAFASEVEWVSTERVSPGATIEITADGRLTGGGELVYTPELDGQREEPFGRLHAWLASVAEGMPKARPGGEDDGGPLLADGLLLIRADRDAPFRYVKKVMEQCGRADVQIWRIRFEVDTNAEPPEGAAEGALPTLGAHLPHDVVQHTEDELPEKIEVVLSVVEEGRKVRADGSDEDWDGSPDVPWRYDPHTRVTDYRIGPRKTRDLALIEERLTLLHQTDTSRGLVIDARPGTLFAEVVAVMVVGRASGYVEVGFVGSYD